MRSKTSDTNLINLFLDMLAAEQGAGDNTLDAYRRDLEDFSEFLSRDGHGFAGVETQALRDYLADLDARGFKSSSVARRLSSMRHLFRFLLHEQIRSDDPVRPEARPRPAEGAVDSGRRSPAGAREGARGSAGSLCAAAASRPANVLPA
jgi:integrase/recombinase XerD